MLVPRGVSVTEVIRDSELVAEVRSSFVGEW
jgi:hypothetical protein